MNQVIDRVSKGTLFSLPVFLIVSSLMGQSVPTTEPPKYPTFRIGGFADLELHTSSNNLREGLDLAELDLYPTAQFSDRWSALAEVVALRDLRPATTETGKKPLFELDLERLFVAYEPTDLLRIEAGETHTGIVRWNEREHRSRLLQTPIDVPAIARPPQDDGAWPLRFVGLWLNGRSNGPLGFRYGVALGNGSGRVRDSIPIFGGDRSTAGLLSLSIEPARWHGLELAIAGYAQRIPTAEPLQERDVTFSMSFVDRGTEVRMEWARMLHTAARSGKHFRSTGYYVLGSQRLAGRLARLRPYVLIDRLNLAPGEDYLRDSRNENAWAGGLKLDLTGHLTVKSEFRSQRSRDGDREELLGLQFGLSF